MADVVGRAAKYFEQHVCASVCLTICQFVFLSVRSLITACTVVQVAVKANSQSKFRPPSDETRERISTGLGQFE